MRGFKLTRKAELDKQRKQPAPEVFSQPGQPLSDPDTPYGSARQGAEALPGDVVFENGDIQLVSEGGLLTQTVEQLLGANHGEWWLNEEEGINFRVMLDKNPDPERVRDEISAGLLQVDSSFQIQDYQAEMKDRQLCIRFDASSDSGRAAGTVGYEQ